MNTPNGLPPQVALTHALGLLVPLLALVLILTIFRLTASRRLAKAALRAGVVPRADGLFDPGHRGLDGAPPPDEQAAPLPRRARRYG